MLVWIIGGMFALVAGGVALLGGLAIRTRMLQRRAESPQVPVVETRAQRRWRKTLEGERGQDPDVTQVIPRDHPWIAP